MKMLGEVSMQLMRFVFPPRGSFNTQPYWAVQHVTQISRKKRQGRVTHATRQYESFRVEKKVMAWILALRWEVFAVEEGSVQPKQSNNPHQNLTRFVAHHMYSIF